MYDKKLLQIFEQTSVNKRRSPVSCFMHVTLPGRA